MVQTSKLIVQIYPVPAMQGMEVRETVDRWDIGSAEQKR